MADRGYMHTTYGSIDTPQVAFTEPGFNPAEFSTLCDNISSNIYVIQSNASVLDRSQKQIGSSTDNVQFRDKIQDIQQRTNQLATLTMQYLLQAAAESKYGEKQHKIQAEKFKNEFQTVIKRYSEIQKQLAYKIKATYFKSPSSKTELQSPAAGWSEGSDKTQFLDNMAAQQQAHKQFQRDLEDDHVYALDRDERIRKIESDILDVNDMFKTLAGQVDEQGQTLDSITTHIEGAADDVDAGEQQLIQASGYQRKFRRNLICFLAILFTVAAIIAIIVALSIKS